MFGVFTNMFGMFMFVLLAGLVGEEIRKTNREIGKSGINTKYARGVAARVYLTVLNISKPG